jgi:hypothetical protein
MLPRSKEKPMPSLFTRLTAALTNSRGRQSAGQSPPRVRPQVEALEERQLLSANPVLDNYVTQVYRNVLGRLPDPAGLAYWTDQLQRGLSPGQFASAVTHSAEYYSNLVNGDYLRYLERAGDASLSGWVNALEHGLSDEQLNALIVASPEYLANHGGPTASWVQALYQDVLLRTPSPAEVNGWAGALQNGLSPLQVAQAFTTSPEHAAQEVNLAYLEFLGRSPEATATAVWGNALQHGLTDEDLVATLVSSAEFVQDNPVPQPVTVTGTLFEPRAATFIDSNLGRFELYLSSPDLEAAASNAVINGLPVVVSGLLDKNDVITVTSLVPA